MLNLLMGAPKKIYTLSIAFSEDDDACEYLMEEVYEDEDEFIADCEYEEALESLFTFSPSSNWRIWWVFNPK